MGKCRELILRVCLPSSNKAQEPPVAEKILFDLTALFLALALHKNSSKCLTTNTTVNLKGIILAKTSP